MKRAKRSMLVCMLTIVLTTLLTAGVAQAAGLSGAMWRIVKSPNVGSFDNTLTGVAVVSASNIWAVGNTCCNSNNSGQALIEHWNGSSWQVIPVPNPGSKDNTLTGVATVSASNIWAVGYSQSSNPPIQTLIEHWNGSSWQVVPSPNVGLSINVLSSVAVVSATDVWAVGDYTNDVFSLPYQTLIEHWNGSNWQIVPSPNVGSSDNGLSSVAVVSATDIWAVGSYANTTSGAHSHTLTEHWNGSSWQIVKSPNPGLVDNDLKGVAAVSASSIWAVGGYISSGGSHTLTEHWNGSNWQVIPSRNPGSSVNELRGVTVVSASNIWAVGDYLGSGAPYQTLIEHWNGVSWQVVPSPHTKRAALLQAVAPVPGGTSLWAVGGYGTPLRQNRTLTQFYG